MVIFHDGNYLRFVTTLQTGITDLKKMCNFDIACRYREISASLFLGFLISLISDHLIFIAI